MSGDFYQARFYCQPCTCLWWRKAVALWLCCTVMWGLLLKRALCQMPRLEIVYVFTRLAKPGCGLVLLSKQVSKQNTKLLICTWLGKSHLWLTASLWYSTVLGKTNWKFQAAWEIWLETKLQRSVQRAPSGLLLLARYLSVSPLLTRMSRNHQDPSTLWSKFYHCSLVLTYPHGLALSCKMRQEGNLCSINNKTKTPTNRKTTKMGKTQQTKNV